MNVLRILLPFGVLCLLALLVWLLPTLDPFGKVEAATKVEKTKKEIELIRKVVKTREEKLSQEVKTAEERDDKINEQMKELQERQRRRTMSTQQEINTK